MALRIEVREGEAPLTVRDAAQLDEALGQAAEEARKRGMLGAVLIEAENGNVLTMVVGGDYTVLGFDDYNDQSLRCYASRGASDGVEPMELKLSDTFSTRVAYPLASTGKKCEIHLSVMSISRQLEKPLGLRMVPNIVGDARFDCTVPGRLLSAQPVRPRGLHLEVSR